MSKLSKLKLLEYAWEGAVDTLGRNSGSLSEQEETEIEQHISELVSRIQKAKKEIENKETKK